jgi:hypothetical protein
MTKGENLKPEPWSEDMQKLVTIYLDNTAYGPPKVIGCYADKHTFVEEHLQEYLTQGWKVRSLFGLGGASGICCQGWVAVLLEKDKE